MMKLWLFTLPMSAARLNLIKRTHGDVAFGMLNLVGALEGVVDALHQGGNAVDRVQALVRIHLARHIGVTCHLYRQSPSNLRLQIHLPRN